MPDAEKIVYRLKIPADLLWFKGHFPGSPILPGVVQLEWVIYFARQHFVLAPKLSAVEQLKFQMIIEPDAEVTLSFYYSTGEGSLSFSYESSVGRHSSGRIRFIA